MPALLYRLRILPKIPAKTIVSSEIDPAAVAAFLRANPGWLAEQPDLYRILAPPERVHGEALTDHMAVMLQLARQDAALMAERADDVLTAGRAAAGLAQRVQDAVLALIRSGDPAECINAELGGILRIDSAALCAEPLPPGTLMAGARELPIGVVGMLLEGRDVAFRTGPAETRMLHGEAAALASFDALVRIPGAGPPAMLALATRDTRALDPSQGSGALVFLGRAIAAALGR